MFLDLITNTKFIFKGTTICTSTYFELFFTKFYSFRNSGLQVTDIQKKRCWIFLQVITSTNNKNIAGSTNWLEHSLYLPKVVFYVYLSLFSFFFFFLDILFWLFRSSQKISLRVVQSLDKSSVWNFLGWNSLAL